MLPQGIEWLFVIWFYLVQVALPILLFIAAVLVIVRMVRGVKVRDISAEGEQKVAEAAVRAAESVARSAATDDARGDGTLRVELQRARVGLVLADAGLTKRERTVLLESHDGKSLAEIASDLDVSRSTVGTYCSRAYEKLGVSSKEEAAALLARTKRGFALHDRGLSEGEVEVALLAADDMRASAIAEKLVVAEATVNSRLQQVYRKLNVHSRDELADLLQNGLL